MNLLRTRCPQSFNTGKICSIHLQYFEFIFMFLILKQQLESNLVDSPVPSESCTTSITVTYFQDNTASNRRKVIRKISEISGLKINTLSLNLFSWNEMVQPCFLAYAQGQTVL